MLNAQRPRGFSLVELLVTITVLGLMLLATMPSISAWLRNTQIRTAAEAIQTGLQKARAEAVRRNLPMMFSLVTGANVGVLGSDCTLSSTSASWVVSRDNPAGLCDKTPGDSAAPRLVDKYAQGDGAPNVSVQVRQADCSTAGNATQIAFNGYGQLDTTTVAAPIRCIDISHTDSSTTKMRIEIGSGGTLRLCIPGVTNTDDPRICQINTAP